MKRIIIIALLSLIGVTASAQLKVEKQTKDPEVISSYYADGYPGAARLKRANDGHYYMTIVSFNRFDDIFLFFLGDNKEKACQTLLDLEGLYKEKKVTTTVTNYGEKCDIQRYSGIKLQMFQRGYAGDIFLYKQAVQKFILDIGKD